jgi:hypothetical protein
MKLYDKAAAQLSVTTAGQLTRLQEHYDSYAKLAAKSKEILEMRTREYLASGVAYNCLAFQQAMAITGTDPKGYFKALAKELSRPFVYASDEKTLISTTTTPSLLSRPPTASRTWWLGLTWSRAPTLPLGRGTT